jgi:hypothetical protein
MATLTRIKDTPVLKRLRRMYAVRHRPVLWDSSFAYGNIAERFHNFDDRLEEPILELDSDDGYPVVHLVPFFNKLLQVTKESIRLERLLRRHDRSVDDEGSCIWHGHVDFLKEEFSDRYSDVRVGYTYNFDNSFDRDFQYLTCVSDNNNEGLIAISLHTGCDARSGLTPYECFSLGDDNGGYCENAIRLFYPDIDFDLSNENWESSYALERDGGVWDREKQKWFLNGEEVSVWLNDDF